ncbi:hypothetical protein KM043_016685 [Ampulex compressa]|nr:hypothetical protein KM043_016685 [Ampulex compressa]
MSATMNNSIPARRPPSPLVLMRRNDDTGSVVDRIPGKRGARQTGKSKIDVANDIGRRLGSGVIAAGNVDVLRDKFGVAFSESRRRVGRPGGWGLRWSQRAEEGEGERRRGATAARADRGCLGIGSALGRSSRRCAGGTRDRNGGEGESEGASDKETGNARKRGRKRAKVEKKKEVAMEEEGGSGKERARSGLRQRCAAAGGREDTYGQNDEVVGAGERGREGDGRGSEKGRAGDEKEEERGSRTAVCRPWC